MKKLLIVLFVLVSATSFATHNRAGEITYKRIEPFTETVGGVVVPSYNYSITIVIYTDDGSQIADRCSLDTVYFGDGQVASLPRINGGVNGCCNNGEHCGEIIINDLNYRVKRNIYTAIHHYANAGTYLIRVSDPNRNAGVYNMSLSENQAFYIEALLVINNYTGANSSPQFNYPPIDKACKDKCFYHNPGAYDPDGDSLSYELTVCRGNGGAPVAGYFYPSPGNGGQFNIDQTGLITWCNPQNITQYNIAFIIKEWRKNTNGIYGIVGYVLRDMQVIVESCPQNDPPSITTPADTCVEAGALVIKKIKVSDPNAGDFVTLSGEGGAFAATSPAATLNNNSGTISTPNASFYADFRWQTSCEHIRKQPYATVFKAKDNGSRLPQSEDLVYFATYNIRVLPPSVKNVTAVPVGTNIKISWSPISCSPSANPLTGYKIYRKADCSSFTYTPCLTGVPASSGFSFIGQTGTSAITYTDNDNGNGLVVGQNYSYLVVGVYADGTETYGGSQVCTKLKRDTPLLLNVDIKTTSETNGVVYIKWTRPLVARASIASSETGLDTLDFPGPYRFNLKYRLTAPGSSSTFTNIQTFSSLYFLGLDTEYTHTGLNTKISSIEYIVEFEALGLAVFPIKTTSATNTFTDITGSFVTTSQVASSIFLKTTPSDRRIDLSWTSQTPWTNKTYTIWRKDFASYEFLGTTTNTNFADTNSVVNKRNYCYKVVGSGEYSDPSIYKPLINYSQESCATPIDLTPPCVPSASLTATCPDVQEGNTIIHKNGSVRLVWNDVRNISCGDDVVSYNIFFKPTPNDAYKLIQTKQIFYSLGEDWLTSYINDTLQFIAGCYAIQAMDSSGNLSPMSLDFCVDNCPVFELPNVFTPNNDNVNDFFQAIRVRQIKKIDMTVFDRWGNVVYKTDDPYFKWDGISQISKQAVSDGTLLYICDVFEPRLRGLIKRTLKGYVELAR